MEDWPLGEAYETLTNGVTRSGWEERNDCARGRDSDRCGWGYGERQWSEGGGGINQHPAYLYSALTVGLGHD